jgi:hypothetical protein
MVSIGVVIPTIPPRGEEVKRLTRQVDLQTRRPDQVRFEVDHLGLGAAATRNLAMATMKTDFYAFFDDDDIMYSNHLSQLERWQQQTRADLVYSWHDLLPPRRNPLRVSGAAPYGRPFDDAAARSILKGRNFIPIAVLVKREAMEAIEGFTDFKLDKWDPAKCEILDAWQRLLRNGATFAHCPRITWAAVRNGQNTAGLDWHHHTGTKQKGYDKGAGK